MEQIKYRFEFDGDGWNKILKTFPNATWEYTNEAIEYRKNYAQERLFKDLSFILFLEQRPIAIIPLIVENIREERGILGGVCPLIDTSKNLSYQEKTLSLALKILEDIAKTNCCVKIAFRSDPLVNLISSKHNIYDYNFLMKHGYQNTSINSQIIDLTVETSKLKTQMRKSIKSIINKGLRCYEFEVYGEECVREKFDIYKEMHHSAAGRITRPLVTFDNMFNCCKNNIAYITLAKYKEAYVGSAWISACNGTAYYGSGAEQPGVELPCPVGHALQWNIMCFLKRKGIQFYEIGWQQYGDQVYDKPTEKEVDIAFYKRGLGGFTVSLYRGEKYL